MGATVRREDREDRLQRLRECLQRRDPDLTLRACVERFRFGRQVVSQVAREMGLKFRKGSGVMALDEKPEPPRTVKSFGWLAGGWLEVSRTNLAAKRARQAKPTTPSGGNFHPSRVGENPVDSETTSRQTQSVTRGEHHG